MPPLTPFCQIATFIVPVALGQATERRVARGGITRAINNAPRSTIDPNAKRVWEITTIPMAWDDGTATDIASLLAAAPDGSRRVVTGRMIGGGEAMPGVGVTCIVTYGDIPYRKQAPDRVKRVLTITLTEV